MKPLDPLAPAIMIMLLAAPFSTIVTAGPGSQRTRTGGSALNCFGCCKTTANDECNTAAKPAFPLITMIESYSRPGRRARIGRNRQQDSGEHGLLKQAIATVREAQANQAAVRNSHPSALEEFSEEPLSADTLIEQPPLFLGNGSINKDVRIRVTKVHNAEEITRDGQLLNLFPALPVVSSTLASKAKTSLSEALQYLSEQTTSTPIVTTTSPWSNKQVTVIYHPDVFRAVAEDFGDNLKRGRKGQYLAKASLGSESLLATRFSPSHKDKKLKMMQIFGQKTMKESIPAMQFYTTDAMGELTGNADADPKDVITLMLTKFNLFHMVGLQVQDDEARAFRNAIAPVLSSIYKKSISSGYQFAPEGSAFFNSRYINSFTNLPILHAEIKIQLRRFLGEAYKKKVNESFDSGFLSHEQYIQNYRGGSFARTMIKDWEHITDEEIDDIITMFVAGYDTMTTPLLLGLRDLAMNQEPQQALRAKAQDKFSAYFEIHHGETSLPELTNLTFNQDAFPEIWRFVEETLKRHPPVPFVAREVQSDTAYTLQAENPETKQGYGTTYVMPLHKGSTVGMPICSMHELSPFPTKWTKHAPTKAEAAFMNHSINRCPGQYQARQMLAVMFTAALATTDNFAMANDELMTEYKSTETVLNPLKFNWTRTDYYSAAR